jgi:hypothetical protein
VTEVRPDIFNYCMDLKTVTLNSAINNFNLGGYPNKNGIETFVIPESNAMYVYENKVIYKKTNNRFVYAVFNVNGDLNIKEGSAWFELQYSLSGPRIGINNLHIPASFNFSTYWAYVDVDLNSITVDASNPNFSSENGDLFNKTKTHLIKMGNKISSTIPSSVTQIESRAGKFMSKATEIIVLATTPPTLLGTDCFDGIPSGCQIKVPVGTLSAYQSATNWSEYAAKMVENV